MEPSRRTRVPSLGSQLFGAGVIDGAASFLKSCETVPLAAHGMRMSMSVPDGCTKALPRPCSSGLAHADMDLPRCKPVRRLPVDLPSDSRQ